jgi:hypothetical protein
MPFSGMRRRVGLVRTDVSEEHVTSIFRVEKIRERESIGRLLTVLANCCLASTIRFMAQNMDLFEGPNKSLIFSGCRAIYHLRKHVDFTDAGCTDGKY